MSFSFLLYHIYCIVVLSLTAVIVQNQSKNPHHWEAMFSKESLFLNQRGVTIVGTWFGNMTSPLWTIHPLTHTHIQGEREREKRERETNECVVCAPGVNSC